MPSPSAWLASSRFHRSFTLPADPDSDRPHSLRITYSDIGYGSSDAAAIPGTNLDSSPLPKLVVVFIGGLMGGRYTLLTQHDFCLHHHIRILTVDRPGMGGSDAVPISQRISTWLATFPALLSHLNISHVAITCHSGGTIYALNTLLHYPELLHPTKPCVSFLAPWVFPADSSTMKLLLWLPKSGPANFDSLVRLVNSYVAPMVGFSSGIGNLISSGVARVGEGESEESTVTHAEVTQDGQGHDRTREDVKWMKEARSLIVKYLVSEDISGSSDEATLLLRKDKSVQRWGGDIWGDYSEATKLITAKYARGLRVSVFHAATDKLNGDGGARYFDRCWEDLSKTSNGGTIEYESQKCEGTDHDSIIDPLKGPLRGWLLSLINEK